jgi:hypothetical protein
MARYGNLGSKNFGYGNQIEHATKNALRGHYGGGHFQTVEAHVDRSRLFYDWLQAEYGITDSRKITKKILLNYSLHLKLLLSEEAISISTVTNRISTVNVVMKIMRGDQKVRIDKIADTVGEKRCYIRRSIPDGVDLYQVTELRNHLIATGYKRAAAIVWLARSTGMRLRECILADLPRLWREALDQEQINIQDGCKGGRSGCFAPRWIPVSEEIVSALDYARRVSPVGSHNLLALEETYIQFLRREFAAARPLMKLHGIKGPHELRAAYACDRYKALVNIPPPVFPRPEIVLDQFADAIRSARQIISRELGHERLEVTNSYLGSERK